MTLPRRLPLFVLLALATLAPFVILPGSHDAANLPQSLAVEAGSLLLAIAWALTRTEARRPTPLDLPLLAFLAWGLASVLWARDDAAVVERVAHWAACALVFAITAEAVRSDADRRLLLEALFASGLGTAAIGLLQHFGGLQSIPQAVPPAGTFVHKNVAVQHLLLTLPLGLALLLDASRRARIWLGAGALVGVLFLFQAFTRSGWLALLVALGVLLALAAGPARRLALGIAGGLLGATLLFAIATGQLGAAATRAAEAAGFLAPEDHAPPGQEAPFTSVHHRRAIWLNTLAMIQAKPWAGVGVGNHAAEYPAWAHHAAVDKVFGATAQLDWAHDDVLQVAAELGLPGVLLMAWVGGAAFVVWRRASAAGAPRALLLGSAAALLAIVTDSLFSFPLERAIPPLLAAVLLGALAAQPERQAVPAPRATGLAAAFALLLVAVIALGGRSLIADRHLARALGAERRSDWGTAYVEARAAATFAPLRSEPYFVMGTALLASGQPDKAIPLLQEVLKTRPHDLGTWGNLGGAYSALGQSGPALDAFQRIVDLKPDEPVANYRLGQLYEKQGNRQVALGFYRAAVQAQPGSSAFRYRLGMLALQLGNNEEARANLEETLRLDPGSGSAHKALGVLLHDVLGQQEAGREHLRRALELLPNDPNAAHMRELAEGK